MFYVVYIDVLFLVNFFMDFIVLTAAGALLNIRAGWLKRAAGAAIGAACYCITLCLPWENRILAGRGIMLIAACAMGRFVFSLRGIKKLARFLLIFHAAAFFFGGAVTAIYHYTRLGYYIRKAAKGDAYAQMLTGILALIVLVSCIFGKLAAACLKQRLKQKSLYYEIELSQGEKRKKATALLDTGNHLKEPVSQKPVILMDMALAGELLEEGTTRAVAEFYQTGFLQEAKEGIRLIPYHSVGKSHGLLAAVFLEGLQIWMEQEVIELSEVCAALTEEPVSSGGTYQVLLNAELMEAYRTNRE